MKISKFSINFIFYFDIRHRVENWKIGWEKNEQISLSLIQSQKISEIFGSFNLS